MRLGVSALGALLATACAVPNPLYGADTGSRGDGDGDGDGGGSTDGDSGVAGTTAMSTNVTGTVGSGGTHSTTGTSTAAAGTATMDDTAGDETDAAPSSTSGDTVGPVQPPCSEIPDGFDVVGCWDFDALNAAGDEVFNRVEGGPSIHFSRPIDTAPGLWGDALVVEGSPSGSAEIDPMENVLIEIWFQTEPLGEWPLNGTLLRLWRDLEQTNEFASLTLLGLPVAVRRFGAALQVSDLDTVNAVTDCSAFEVIIGQNMRIRTGLSSGSFFANVGNIGEGGFAFTVGDGAAAIIDGIRISSLWNAEEICSPPPPGP